MAKCKHWLDGFCGFCYENATRGENHQGHYRARSRPRHFGEGVMAYLRRTDGAKSAKGAIPANEAEDLAAGKVPALVEFLARIQWEEGTPRLTGTLLLCTGEGRWRACVHDRDGQRQAWVSADSLRALVVAVDAKLRDDSMDWRDDPPSGRKR